MGDVRRWESPVGWMEEDESGGLVNYTDYAALRARLDAMEGAWITLDMCQDWDSAALDEEVADALRRMRATLSADAVPCDTLGERLVRLDCLVEPTHSPHADCAWVATFYGGRDGYLGPTPAAAVAALEAALSGEEVGDG